MAKQPTPRDGINYPYKIKLETEATDSTTNSRVVGETLLVGLL